MELAQQHCLYLKDRTAMILMQFNHIRIKLILKMMKKCTKLHTGYQIEECSSECTTSMTASPTLHMIK